MSGDEIIVSGDLVHDDKQQIDVYKSAKKMATSIVGSARPIDMNAINLIWALAPAWTESKWFGIRSAESAVVVMAKAFELGFPITTAFEYIYVITTQGGTRLVLSPKGALALIYRSRLMLKFEVKEKPGSCTVFMSRKDNGYGFELTYTLDMAKAAGLVKPKGAWESYPQNMLRWRAIGFCSDIVFPDVKGGLHQADEFDLPIDDEGGIIDGV